MLCQNVCVVPLGIMATVNVDDDEDEEDWFAALLHAPAAHAAHVAATKNPVAKIRFMRCCCIRGSLSAFLTARAAALEDSLSSRGPQALCPLAVREVPKPPRGSAEDGILFTLRSSVNGRADDLNYLSILGCERAHRPVGSKHQTLRPKRLDRGVHVPVKILDCPSIPIGLGHQP